MKIFRIKRMVSVLGLVAALTVAGSGSAFASDSMEFGDFGGGGGNGGPYQGGMTPVGCGYGGSTC